MIFECWIYQTRLLIIHFSGINTEMSSRCQRNTINQRSLCNTKFYQSQLIRIISELKLFKVKLGHVISLCKKLTKLCSVKFCAQARSLNIYYAWKHKLMVLILDGYSEHVAHALRKNRSLRRKNLIGDCPRSNEMP